MDEDEEDEECVAVDPIGSIPLSSDPLMSTYEESNKYSFVIAYK